MLDPRELAETAAAFGVSAEVAARVKWATGWSVTPQTLRASLALDWETQLAHQTQILPTSQRCLDIVLDAYGRALAWPPPQEPYE
jgi:hypothetical protein